eukprot:UN24673
MNEQYPGKDGMNNSITWFEKQFQINEKYSRSCPAPCCATTDEHYCHNFHSNIMTAGRNVRLKRSYSKTVEAECYYHWYRKSEILEGFSGKWLVFIGDRITQGLFLALWQILHEDDKIYDKFDEKKWFQPKVFFGKWHR